MAWEVEGLGDGREAATAAEVGEAQEEMAGTRRKTPICLRTESCGRLRRTSSSR